MAKAKVMILWKASLFVLLSLSMSWAVSDERSEPNDSSSSSATEMTKTSPDGKLDHDDNDEKRDEKPNNRTAASGEPPPDSTSQKKDRLSDLKIIDQLLRKYDRRATPTNKIGTPTEVGCELFIRSFGSISEKTMDYQVDLYLRQHWEDPRLNHAAISEALDLNDPKLVQAIWKPEVYFPNAKEGEFQYVTVPNVLLRIKPNGNILYMLRLKMKFSCMMELYKYPLDVQVCTMEIASFSKTTRELLLEWNKENPVDLSADLKMPQFTVQRVATEHCEESTSLIGNYSCLVAKFHLSRSVGFHMVQSYVPTILIVVISWVTFWMGVDSVPGRITLGVTTLLTVSSKSAGLNAETPQVSYVKAIDVWMGACTAFIFAALIEFTFVNYLWRKQRINYALNSRNSLQRARFAVGSIHNDGMDGDEDGVGEDEDGMGMMVVGESREAPGGGTGSCSSSNKNHSPSIESRRHKLFDEEESQRRRLNNGRAMSWRRHDDILGPTTSMAVKFDESCRILFPLNFLCFNIFYWVYYLYY